MRQITLVVAAILILDSPVPAQSLGKPRARDLGVPFDGTPGPLNAITDVKGVEVGFTTLIDGTGPLKVGAGPIRTGVTAILPRGKQSRDPVFAGWFSLNGNGEMTGTAWVEESGFLEGPLMITNTHSVGVVRDAVVAWQVKNKLLFQSFSMPVVAETWDGYLNDSNGFHVKPEHAHAALDTAASGPVAEGNVGGGTGMICFEFKGGTGTSSRKLPRQAGGYTVGVLVQANFGARHQLQIAGVPVGKEITEQAPMSKGQDRYNIKEQGGARRGSRARRGSPTPPHDYTAGSETHAELGSIIIVVATDAPLLPHQCKRLARRAALGLARTGGAAGNGSGDLFLAFSTANPGTAAPNGVAQVQMLRNGVMDGLFGATILATEEAIINAMVAAETMTGRDDHKIIALPHDRLREVLKKYNRLAP